MKRAKAGKMKRMRPTKVWAAVFKKTGDVMDVSDVRSSLLVNVGGRFKVCEHERIVGPITIKEPRAVARARGGRG